MGEEWGVEALHVGSAQRLNLGEGSGDPGAIPGCPLGSRSCRCGFDIGDHIECVGRPALPQQGKQASNNRLRTGFGAGIWPYRPGQDP